MCREGVWLRLCLKIFGHTAKAAQHSDVALRKADANESGCSGMAQHPPHPLRSLDRRCGTGAFGLIARDQVASCEVERHGDKMCDVADGAPPKFSSGKPILTVHALN